MTAHGDELQVLENDGQHLLVRWGDAEMIVSVATGTLQAAIMAPAQSYTVVSNQNGTDDIVQSVFVGIAPNTR